MVGQVEHLSDRYAPHLGVHAGRLQLGLHQLGDPLVAGIVARVAEVDLLVTRRLHRGRQLGRVVWSVVHGRAGRQLVDREGLGGNRAVVAVDLGHDRLLVNGRRQRRPYCLILEGALVLVDEQQRLQQCREPLDLEVLVAGEGGDVGRGEPVDDHRQLPRLELQPLRRDVG